MTDSEELVRPLAGSDWWNVPGSGDVPGFRVSDGPSGARGQLFMGGPPSVSFPCGAALGATWDVDLVGRVGAALAEEARAKGAHVLLGPTVNLQRTPLGGRHFECFSEDPVLTAELAVAYVEGLQGAGVAACVKHLVANDQEHDRFEVSSEPDERTLREVSLLPFEHALRRAGAWSTMAAYNRLHGTHCSQHERLLTTILRDEWGWDGVVISDWFAVHATVEPAMAGLDLEMPGPPLHWGPALAAAVARGDVPVEVIEAKRARLAQLGRRTGAHRGPAPEESPGGSPAAVAIAREAAAAAAVLLRNEGVLPLDPDALGHIAVVGPNADREVIQGGGSARVTPTDVVTVAMGLQERLGDSVVVAPGPRASRGTPTLPGADLRRADGTTGADVSIVGADGVVRARLRPRDLSIIFMDDAGVVTAGEWSAHLSATYTPRATGPHRCKVKTNGDATLTVDGAPVTDVVDLEAGVPVALELVARGDPGMRLLAELRCAPPEAPDALEHSVATARDADAAIVVVGLDGDWETEGRDRDALDLPGRQVELIRAVAAAQPRTVVVVVAGSPVDLSWAAEVPAVLWVWLPGQEGGRAVADVLLGDAEPGGRLPCTLPARLEDTPSFLDTEPGVLRYPEGVFTGHRWYDARGIEPAFPFGFGLGYTTWALGDPIVGGPIEPDDVVQVRVPVTNTGGRRATCTVQVYVGHPGAPRPRAVRELRGFAKVAVDAGGADEVVVTLTMRDLAHWDPVAEAWVAEAGEHLVWAGTSSRALTSPVTLVLTEPWRAPASAPPPRR